MTEKTFKRFLVSVLSISLCALMIIVSPVVLANQGEGSSEAATTSGNSTDEEYRNQISNLQDEQVKIQKEMQDYNNKISNIKDSKKKQQAIANSIDEKISITEKAISVGLAKIELTNTYIDNKLVDNYQNHNRDLTVQ